LRVEDGDGVLFFLSNAVGKREENG
jgi:hypothetical protein